jgi:hypothetical protein
MIVHLPEDINLDRVCAAFQESAATQQSYQVRGDRHSEEHTAMIGRYPLRLPSIYFLTKLGWLDVVDLEIGRDVTGRTLRLSSVSTSWVPAIIPLAPLLGMLLAWIIFFDHGANLAHLELLYQDLCQSTQQHLHYQITGRGKVMGFIEYFLVFFVFALTLAATACNVLYNDIPALNIGVTVVCAILTLHTFITLAAASCQCWAARKHAASRPLSINEDDL